MIDCNVDGESHQTDRQSIGRLQVYTRPKERVIDSNFEREQEEKLELATERERDTFLERFISVCVCVAPFMYSKSRRRRA